MNEDDTLCCVHHRGMHDQGGRCTIAGCQCKWGSSRSVVRKTAAQVPEPTTAQMAAAREIVSREWPEFPTDGIGEWETRNIVANAIAAAVAAERAKYVELANKWETYTKGAGMWEPEDARPLRDATDELREVIEQ